MSWIDRIAGPEGRLARVPWWVWVPAGWVVIGLLLQAPRWIAGDPSFPTLDRWPVTDPFYVVAPLASYLVLSRAARRAFDRFRPAMSTDDATAGLARQRLSSSQAVPAAIALVVGGSVGVASYFADDSYGPILDASAAAKGIWLASGFVGFGLHIVLATLIVRQLRMVAVLHRTAAVDLYRPTPLHAFASLTARAGIVVLALAMYSALTDPTTFVNPVWRTVFIAAMALASAAFFIPLAGLGSRLRTEKRSLLDASRERTRDLTGELQSALDRRDLAAAGDLRTALAALDDEQARIRKMSAWPWETATLRGFATTLLIPITTWLITNLLGETLGF